MTVAYRVVISIALDAEGNLVGHHAYALQGGFKLDDVRDIPRVIADGLFPAMKEAITELWL